MRIENRTPWKTEHLRAIARRVLEDVVNTEVRKRAAISFVSGRRVPVGGYAYHDRVYARRIGQGTYWYMKITVPAPNGIRAKFVTTQTPESATWNPLLRPGALQVEIAQVIAHETGHWKGFSNRELRGSKVHDTRTAETRERFAWAADMPLEPAEKKIVPTDIREARRIRDYQTKVREWETKTKRSQTALTKWRRRLALAESRLQKAARPRMP